MEWNLSNKNIGQVPSLFLNIYLTFPYDERFCNSHFPHIRDVTQQQISWFKVTPDGFPDLIRITVSSHGGWRWPHLHPAWIVMIWPWWPHQDQRGINPGPTLAQRLRRCANIEPACGRCLGKCRDRRPSWLAAHRVSREGPRGIPPVISCRLLALFDHSIPLIQP